MQSQLRFAPDICEKFEQYSRHTTQKHRTINDFISILKQICDLEEFYSRNLEKLAESTSKLILGKDTLKGIFIVFDRLLSSLAEQAKSVAENIKNDMMPYVKTLLDDNNYKYLDQGKHVKEIFSEMQKKFKGLELHKKNYVKAYNSWSINGSLSPPPVKEQLKSTLAIAERELTSNIEHYNQAVDVYILNVSELTSMFCQAETNRKKDLKSAVQKMLIYQVDRIKNVEYNIGNYCKNLDSMEDKLFINQKTQDESERVPLVKVSPSNYLQFLRDGILDHSVISERQHVVGMLRKQLNGEINQGQYNHALKELYSAMDYTLETKNYDMLKEILEYSESVYKVLPEADGQKQQISLKQGIFCHDIFNDEHFWSQYADQVICTIQRENGSLGSFDFNEDSLQEALHFLKHIKTNEVIKKNFLSKLEKEMASHNLQLPRDTDEQHHKTSQEFIALTDQTQQQQSDNKEEAGQHEYTKEEYEAFS